MNVLASCVARCPEAGIEVCSVREGGLLMLLPAAACSLRIPWVQAIVTYITYSCGKMS